MKVALVHDYLTEYGGAERVLEALHELWPDAPVYASLFDEEKLKTSAFAKASADRQNSKLKTKVKSSKLQKLPLASKFAKTFTFFYPLIFENMDLREYDVVISDGTIWSKGVLTTPEQLHIFYCHTPPRFLYGYPGETDRRRLWYLQPLLKPLDNWLRVWDFESAQRPDFIIANSQTTAARIRKFWRRETTVIYPPAAGKTLRVESSKPEGLGKAAGFLGGASDDYFLVVSRLSAYKNVDLAIRVCNQLNLPLVVVGTGREEEKLKALAGPTVKFLKHLKDSELSKVYKDSKVLIHPASDEDFGIAPVEAMSFGKPVIALRSGGVQETVIEGKTGLFFNEPTTGALISAIKQFDTLTINLEDCIEQAAKFSKERFQKEFRSFVEEKLHAKIS